MRACPGMRWPCAQRADASRPHPVRVHFSLQLLNLFFIIHFWYMTIHHHILTSKARPKKTRTTRIHLRRYPTSITAPLSWVRAFSMHSLLIYGGGSIWHPPFFFKPEVDVASSHLVSCLASNLATSALVSSTSSMLAKSARTCTKFRSINISMYSYSKYQNLHSFYIIKLKVNTTSLIR